MTTVAIDARKLRDFGIGTYVRGLVGGLAELDRETRYVLLGDPSHAADLQLPDNFSWRVERSPGYSLRELWSVSRAANAAGAELFHSPHYVLPLRLACPSVVTIHDLIHLRFPDLRGPVERGYARITIARALRTAQRAIAVSEATRRELQEVFGALADRVEAIPNGVDERFRRPLEPPALAAGLARFDLRPGYLLFVGNPKPHKNLAMLLAAHERLRDRSSDAPPLVLAGVDRVAAGGSPDGVVALGTVGDDDLPALYRGARALVVPSRWEGFGLPAVEAMACATPVIAADRGALPEVLGEAGLLYDGDDLGALVAAIERLLDDDAEAARLAEAGRLRSARFSWRETAARTLAVYRQVLDEGRQSR